MNIRKSFFFFFILLTGISHASGISDVIDAVVPAKCLTCNVPPPADFKVAEIGTTWVRLSWTQSTLLSNRVRTFRASDNFLINETIVPPTTASLTVTIPVNTECYSVINAICEDGTNSEDQAVSNRFTTIIVDLIVSGYSSGNGTAQCTISTSGQSCSFASSGIAPFRIRNTVTGSSRGFGIENVGPQHFEFELETSNAGQGLKFYCANYEDPSCYNTTQIVIKSGFNVIATLQPTIGSNTNSLLCTGLAGNYVVESMTQGNGMSSEDDRSNTGESLQVPPISCPNPIRDILPVRFAQVPVGPVTFRLFSANGQCVINRNAIAIGQEYELITSGLPTGCYYLRVETEGISQTIKLFKTE